MPAREARAFALRPAGRYDLRRQGPAQNHRTSSGADCGNGGPAHCRPLSARKTPGARS
jgi:hypothetical protein